MKCRLTSGLVAILLAVATWEAMAKLIAGLHLSAERPLLCVYCTHSGYAIFLFVPCGRRIAAKLGWRVQRRMPAEDAPHRRAPAAGGLLSRRMLGGSFLLALFWTASAYLWFVSLHLTLVSVNNCLFQSSAVFVFALSVPLLKERVTLLKAGASDLILVDSKGSIYDGRPDLSEALGRGLAHAPPCSDQEHDPIAELIDRHHRRATPPRCQQDRRFYRRRDAEHGSLVVRVSIVCDQVA